MEPRLIIYAVIVTALVVAEFRGLRRAQIVFKTLAAFGFCYIALWSGALSSLYGQMIFAALSFCTIGDICLLSRGRPPLFQAGMAAFAVGHLLYVAAFSIFDINLIYAAIGLIIMGPLSILMFKHLKPYIAGGGTSGNMAPGDMSGPVGIYHIIITLMVAAAIGTQNWALIIPALLFAVSDMFVGQDRFVKNTPMNAVIITPLYFGAQALFALSV